MTLMTVKLFCSDDSFIEFSRSKQNNYSNTLCKRVLAAALMAAWPSQQQRPRLFRSERADDRRQNSRASPQYSRLLP